MQIAIASDKIEAIFSDQGAELQSLKNKQTGLSYIWAGDPHYWGKHSPLLFPIVGALKNDSYEYDGKAYSLPRHGFARDMVFEVAGQSAESITFTLAYSEETLAKYPFRFRLSVIYELVGATMKCTYQVENLDQQQLLFSIGGHPAFAVPLQEGQHYTDYYLEFSADTELHYHQIENNLISDVVGSIPLTDRKLRLEHELFYQDALVFKSLKSNQIILGNNRNEHGLKFEFHGFPYFGIWAAKDADFVCLEPWCGIADSVNHDQNLANKEGLVRLGENAVWKRTWQVTCF